MSAILANLRNGAWLTPSRLRLWTAAAILCALVTIAWTLSGRGLEDPAGHPVGTDFVSFWSVSWALHHGHTDEIYHPTALAALERLLSASATTPFYAWQYPPIALPFVYPLAWLSYPWALCAWLAVGIAGYLSVLWRILPRPATLWLGLAFPAVFLTIVHGQNAFLTTALLGWALLLLPRRPAAAGVLIGLLTFKPQLGLLLPVALIAGGHWRTIAAACLTAIALMAATALVFGIDIWRDFAVSTQFSRAMLDQGLVPYFKLQSVFAAVRLPGGPLELAYLLQGLVAVAAAAVVGWGWRRPVGADLKAAALAAATPLATPFFLDYDLLVIAPAIAWLAGRSLREGGLPWERSILAMVALMPLFTRGIGEYTHVLVAPLAVAALLAVVVRRIAVESRSQSTARASGEDAGCAFSPADAGERLPGRHVKIADIA
jgi:glycosyl transferase family 87